MFSSLEIRPSKGLQLLALSVFALVIAASSAFAAFPGSNGQIAWEGETSTTDFDIWTMASNGTDGKDLTPISESDSTPFWHPDGSKFIFRSSRIGEPGFWTMNGDGSGGTRIFSSTTDSQPAYTPDGSKVVFVSSRDGNSEIYIMNADSSNQTRLTNNSSTDTSPKVSPDGSSIVFVSSRDGNTEIYKMGIDGSNQTRLTNNSTPANSDGDFSPDWSPDGSKIVFGSERNGGDGDIFVMLADGSNVGPLTNNTKDDTDPAYSPDGNQIVYASKNNSDGGSDYEIHKMNGDGSGDTQLTSNSSTLDDISPNWEPLPNGNLGATATAVTASVFVGQDVTFTFGINNAGATTIYGTKLTGTLPSGFTLKSATPSTGSCSSGTVECSFGTLAGGASATVSVVATAPTTAGTYTANVSVEGNGGETSTSDNTASANVTISTDTVAPTAKIVLPSCKKNGKQLTGTSCTRYRYTRTNWRTLQATLSDPTPSLGGVTKGQFQFYRKSGKKCIVYKSKKTTKKVKCSQAKNTWVDGAVAAKNKRGVTHSLKLAKSPKAGTWTLRVRGIDAGNNTTSTFSKSKSNQLSLKLKNAKKSKKKKKKS